MDDSAPQKAPDEAPSSARQPSNRPRLAATFNAAVAPIQEFFRLEAASGILLFAAAVTALLPGCWGPWRWRRCWSR